MFFPGMVDTVTGGTIHFVFRMGIELGFILCMGIGMALRANFKTLQEVSL
jgi:hypothetical protein